MEISGKWGAEGLKDEIGKAHFFRDPDSLVSLKTFYAETFVSGLPSRTLFVHIAGAAMDSLNALGDSTKAGKFLDILKSDYWVEKGHVNKTDPQGSVETAIAFTMVADDAPIAEHAEFISLCEENEITINIDNINEKIVKMRRNL